MYPKHIHSLLILILSGFSISLQAQQDKPPCSGGSYELVKPYLGTWGEYRVTDSTEVFTGTLTTKLDVMGCAITQQFMEQDSSFMYKSFGFVNPGSGLWQETYVFSTGGTSVYQWIVEDGALYTRRIQGSNATDHIYRLKYVDVSENEYAVVPQRSFDGGRTWKEDNPTKIKKIN